jgi:ABC-type uncharacterized transport system involved in gliding motility auxiliary subunit
MRVNRKVRLRVALQNSVFVVLIIVFAGLLAVAAREYRAQWYVTSSGRNTLSAASIDLLRKIEGPVAVTAYATPQDARFGDLRKLIRDFVARYQRAKPDIQLDFIDPRDQPKAATAAGVQVNGELVVEYGGRRERLSNLSEVAFTNVLVRLARATERLVMSLDGHGERSLINGANHDLGDFGKQLAAKGIEVSALNLVIAPDVPDNVALLVIASPQTQVLPNEIARLERYLERGGNLLWLIDQEPLYGLEPVAEQLGLILMPGIVVDPDSIERGGRPVMAVAAAGNYSSHPVVRAFRFNTLFPFARALTTNPIADWSVIRLIEVAPRGWIETDNLDRRIVFDQGRDIPGPATIALAFERSRNERTQRVVVVGSGHFLANTYLGNGGNLDLGINMVNWLMGDDILIAVQPRRVPDASLALSKVSLLSIVGAYLIVLPLLLLSFGALIWWRRRRA